MYVCMYVCTCVCMYACMHVCMHVCTECMCVVLCMSVYVYELCNLLFVNGPFCGLACAPAYLCTGHRHSHDVCFCAHLHGHRFAAHILAFMLLLPSTKKKAFPTGAHLNHLITMIINEGKSLSSGVLILLELMQYYVFTKI